MEPYHSFNDSSDDLGHLIVDISHKIMTLRDENIVLLMTFFNRKML